MITNNETTGRTGTCGACGADVEEALLLKGMTTPAVVDGKPILVTSPGIPTWRRLDRGHASAKCPATPDGWHHVTTPSTTPRTGP